MSLPILEEAPFRHHHPEIHRNCLHEQPPKMFRDSSTQKYDPLPIDYGPSESERGRIKKAHLEEDQRLAQITYLVESVKEK